MNSRATTSDSHGPDSRQAGVTRRSFLAAAAVAGAAGSLVLGDPGSASAQAPAVSSRAAASRSGEWFARPGAAVRPKFRYWWPDGLVDPAEIAREIDQIADAGFGGVEISANHHSITDVTVLQPKTYGWGTAPWNAGVESALEQAARRGISVDITVGPSWPAAVPSITPDSPAAMKELAYGSVSVAAGARYSGPVPPAVQAAAPGVTVQNLLLVQAARVYAANTTRKATGLDPASVVDLTSTVTGGTTIDWTAPTDGPYVLISYWVRGSGQQPEAGPHTDPPAYVVDHFSAAGTRAVTDFWEKELLTPRIRKLLKQAGGALFEDSIEIETKALMWTAELPAAFQRRTGRSLLPYLPVIMQNNGKPVFVYDTTTTNEALLDFWQTVSDLFNRNHFTPLKEWAHSIGLLLRGQPYGLQTDSIESAAILDIPEGESLGFKNLDDFRCLAGGRDMAGRKILSCEAGAFAGGAYNTTWNKFLHTMGGAYAAGVNQSVIHGFSYATAPGAAWPGFAAFTPYGGTVGYGESWGPRQPTWRHITDISGYLSRVHQVLQAGEPRADVAVFRQTGYSATGIGASWFTPTGITLGWTHQLLSSTLLDLPDATVRKGRLAPDGIAYKVMFIEGDHFNGSLCTLRVADARRLLALTRAGLPLVFLGAWNAAAPPGLPVTGRQAELANVMAQLLSQRRVRVVAAAADVPGALADLGLGPDAGYSTPSTLLNAHRVADGVDYYYLCNGQHAATVKPPVAAIDHEVSFRASAADAVPYRLDLWSGKAERIAQYTRDGDVITLRVTLQPSQAHVVALGRPGLFGDDLRGNQPFATATDADSVLFVDSGLAVRSAKAGSYTTELSRGPAAVAVIGAVPDPIPLTAWQLEVDDWQPDATGTGTAVVHHSLALDALAPWSAVPELQDVSGIGTYTATLDLPESWTGGFGATLHLGAATDTCRVTVNGTRLDPVDQIGLVADVGPYLRRGRNTVQVEVATPLENRLRVSDPAVYAVAGRGAYGLLGPVQLVPYGQARAE
ncbi:glycosyl hydrolase [Streptacidiphilus carbonis]|uniref:glycosyl hydrolase n=1 Tax=Streptacidiphilus carbonis TaxID=105422 RepID=UPI0005A8864F|nr:glycosyl hydrolase [Streptacidiphilus carbonis]